MTPRWLRARNLVIPLAVLGLIVVIDALLPARMDSTVTVVNCGHPPPLLVTSADSGRLVDSGVPTVPLGLGPSPDAVTFKLPARARLLFYTDGLVETRNHNGDFFPLDGRVSVALHEDTLGHALDSLLTLLNKHAGHRINDDVALLLVERRAS